MFCAAPCSCPRGKPRDFEKGRFPFGLGTERIYRYCSFGNAKNIISIRALNVFGREKRKAKDILDAALQA